MLLKRFLSIIQLYIISIRIISVFSNGVPDIFIRNNNVKRSSKEIIIHFNDTNFYNMETIINQNQNTNELIIRFVDNYYDLSLLWYSVELEIKANVSIIGNKNGTIFDFKGDHRGRVCFNFIKTENVAVKVENLILQNFSTQGVYIEKEIIKVIAGKNDLQVIFNNCVFRNNDYHIIQYDIHTNNGEIFPITQFIFNECDFYNNKERLIFVYQHSDIRDYRSINMNVTKCNFINNRGLFFTFDSYLTIDDCYFSDVDRDSDLSFENVFYYSPIPSISKAVLDIKNSKFENINVKSELPLITANNLILKIENTSFKNCYSAYGYLFNIFYKFSIPHININNSTFTETSALFRGKALKLMISDTNFYNITINKYIPLLSDAKYSSVVVVNSKFDKISLMNGFVNEETSCSFYNTDLNNIKSSSNSLLYTKYHNIYIDGMNIENVSCYGDGSFILFETGDAENRLTIKNLNIKKSNFNGPFIKLEGNYGEVIFENSNLSDVNTYGSIIKDKLEKI
ncbi:hypothetical protein BCR32DRAFT_295479 [Anaeromyces robustus]|uniref:Right handed beta helix domain-containing protein n=1 Tax=Anaeromyces robustus TaxID=1754192 RepID=A0A1Y1WWR9_9FUNG|nr:hypothetical protein BCR32DRAFT_295479 [Anaeromyces robustus]|eukprot:ORX77656.1 hypothetical protein BCR32DRAFT_295479 [Anaeromyces robustus]